MLRGGKLLNNEIGFSSCECIAGAGAGGRGDRADACGGRAGQSSAGKEGRIGCEERVAADGSDVRQVTRFKTVSTYPQFSPDGKKIVFTSTRDGDLELYDMNLDGSNPRRLTRDLGYDGGAWHSQDGQWIVWRANRPKTPEEVKRYKDLFAKNLVMPAKMELFTMRADGTEQRQITNNGAANFAPYFLPNGKQIIFASNMNDPRGGNFDLFLINRDGTGLQQITFDQNFDGFPMFSPDGKKIVWESNRNSRIRGETNVFIADWVE